MEEKILKIVENTQEGCVNHMKSVKLLEKVYNSSDYDQFLKCFLRLLQGIIQEDFQNTSVKYVLNFLAKFIAHVVSSENTDDNNCSRMESSGHSFLNAVVEGIIEYHDYPAQECRYNTCSFLSLILQNLGEQFVLDNHIIDLMLNAMLENIQDSKPLVRLQAVLALTRLQEPPIPDCPVIRAYINCLRDSNNLVRREAVKRIAPNAITIPMLKEKTRDRDANVRGAAFTHLADIGIKHLKIVHRQFILKSGFSETNSQVKKIFLEYLLPKWLSALNGSYLALLHAIKLDADETDIINTEELSIQLMQVFFKTEPISNLIDALPLDETKLVPENSIKSELAHYWNILVKYLGQSDDLEEYLDKIIPELTIFCNYIDRLISNKFSKTMEDWEYLDFQYILYHLFDMAQNYDLSEEVGRRALDTLVKKVLRKHRLQPRLMNKIVQTGSKLLSDADSFSNEICLIISDIWQPLTCQPAVQEANTMEDNFRIAQMKVKLNILHGDLEDAVFDKDFEKAHQLKLEIQECEKKLEEMTVVNAPVEQVRVASDDPETLCWCLDLLAALLIHGNIKTLSPSLVTCRDEFLMPLITSKNVEIGWRAFRCLTVYCIFDKKLAEDQIKTICIPIASYRIIPNFNKEILMDSIGVITNLLLLNGTDLFATEDERNATVSAQNTTKRRLYNEEIDDVDYFSNPVTVDFIVSVLLDMLDDENDDIRDTAVTAIAKLMLNGFPVNSMVLTRLILKWYNPSTQKSLQQKLGMILKCYAETVANAKEIIAKSIVPILTNISEAPRTSPLVEIDIDNVVRFLAAITHSGDRIGFVHVHTELGRILLNEISSRPSESATIYFCKMLNLLDIIPNDSPAVKELITLGELILEKETLDKSPKLHVTKFLGKLNDCTPSSTITTVNNTTSTSGNVTTDQSSRQVDSRRLSTVIEEDKSNDEMEAANDSESRPNDVSNESHEEVPVKKRKIDNNRDVAQQHDVREREVSAVDNTASNIDRANVSEMQFVGVQNSIERNNEAVPKTTTNSASSSSESDIIPSSQTMLAKTINDLKRKEQAMEKVVGSNHAVDNGEKSISGSSEQTVPPVPKVQEQIGKSTRNKAKNGTVQNEEDNSRDNGNKSISGSSEEPFSSRAQEQTGKSTRNRAKNGTVQEEEDNSRAVRSLRGMNTDQRESSDSSIRPASRPLVNSSSNEAIGKNTRIPARGSKKLVRNKSTVKEINVRVGKKLQNIQPSDPTEQSAPSSTSSASTQEDVRRSLRKGTGTRKSLDNGTEKTDTSDQEAENRNKRKSTGRRKSARIETHNVVSSSSAEQTESASSATSSSQESVRITRRGNRVSAANARTGNSKKNKTDVAKQRDVIKSVRKNPTESSSKSDASSNESEASQSSTRSTATSSTSSGTNKRSTRSVTENNARMNGVRKPSEKENPILSPPSRTKRRPQRSLDFDSPSKNLREKHVNNILHEKELSMRINGVNNNKSSSNISKTPQVKRKKSRITKIRTEESVHNVMMNTSDSSVDQTLHTIVHPPDFEVGLLEEDSPENTPNRSSRRLRVVLSETSSDESAPMSIRKSKRRTMKKLLRDII